MSLFKLGKLHVPHRKNTADMSAVRMTPPESVLIPMAQHIGAPANPVVKVGDRVFVGTLIGEAAGYVSSNIHSSVSGTVKKIEPFLSSNGRSVMAILIESDGEMTPDPSISAPEINDFDSFSAAIRASGLIGLGGAGFPTQVKLDAQKKGIIKKVIINAAECEPYITSDTRTMLDDTADVVYGIEILEKYITAVLEFTKTFEPITAAGNWNPLGSFRQILKNHPNLPEDLQKKVDEGIADMIDNTIIQMRKFRQPDHGFGYLQCGSSEISNSVKVSLGLPEGDVNALALMMLIYNEAYILTDRPRSHPWEKYRDYFSCITTDNNCNNIRN